MDQKGRAVQNFSVDADPACFDDAFGLAPRSHAGAGQHFGYALTFFFAFRLFFH